MQIQSSYVNLVALFFFCKYRLTMQIQSSYVDLVVLDFLLHRDNFTTQRQFHYTETTAHAPPRPNLCTGNLVLLYQLVFICKFSRTIQFYYRETKKKLVVIYIFTTQRQFTIQRQGAGPNSHPPATAKALQLVSFLFPHLVAFFLSFPPTSFFFSFFSPTQFLFFFCYWSSPATARALQLLQLPRHQRLRLRRGLPAVAAVQREHACRRRSAARGASPTMN